MLGTRFSVFITQHSLLSTQHSALLFDDPVRSRQHARRNRQADLFCSFEIDDQLDHRLLLRLGGRDAIAMMSRLFDELHEDGIVTRLYLGLSRTFSGIGSGAQSSVRRRTGDGDRW
jgi:hypothetical protein